MKTLIFSDNMPKLHDQKFAELVLILHGFHPIVTISNDSMQKFLEYDLKKSNGGDFELSVCPQLILLFVGEKGILFSTLRKDNEENREKYKIGDAYKIEVQA